MITEKIKELTKIIENWKRDIAFRKELLSKDELTLEALERRLEQLQEEYDEENLRHKDL